MEIRYFVKAKVSWKQDCNDYRNDFMCEIHCLRTVKSVLQEILDRIEEYHKKNIGDYKFEIYDLSITYLGEVYE